MPVSDQWKAREKDEKVSVQTDANLKTCPSSDQTAELATGPLSPGRTKGLAGFWATQNDEVKVSRKKRLEAVDTPTTEMVVENVPQKLDGVVRAVDPGSWENSDDIAAGRTRNVASAFQQQQQQQSTCVSQTRTDSDDMRRTKRSVSDVAAPYKKPAQQPDVVTKRSSATVVLAENDPQQLNPDVVRSSEGSSWDDVTELQAGRTRNLLQHWKFTEEDATQPKTSTTRYRS